MLAIPTTFEVFGRRMFPCWSCKLDTVPQCWSL